MSEIGSPMPSEAPGGIPAPGPAGAWSALDLPTRLVVGGGAALVVAALLGLLLGAWSLDPVGLLLLALGAAAAGIAWWTSRPMADGTLRRPLAALQLAVGVVGTALTLLALVEMLGDLDDPDDYGGILGILLAVVVLAASLAILWGSLVRDATWRSRVTGRDAPTRLALLGLGLILLAWILHLTIGVWSFAPAAWGLVALSLAAVIVAWRDDIPLPFPVAWISVILGVFGAWVALGQWSALMDLGAERLELGLDDYLPFLIYVAGILLVIGGAVLAATGFAGRTGVATPAAPAAPPPATEPPIVDPDELTPAP